MLACYLACPMMIIDSNPPQLQTSRSTVLFFVFSFFNFYKVKGWCFIIPEEKQLRSISAHFLSTKILTHSICSISQPISTPRALWFICTYWALTVLQIMRIMHFFPICSVSCFPWERVFPCLVYYGFLVPRHLEQLLTCGKNSAWLSDISFNLWHTQPLVGSRSFLAPLNY